MQWKSEAKEDIHVLRSEAKLKANELIDTEKQMERNNELQEAKFN